MAFSVSPPLDVGSAPVHPSPVAPPLAVQAVAFVLDHLRVGAVPGCIWAGSALFIVSATVGCPGAGAVTVTWIELGALAPPGPVHARVYV